MKTYKVITPAALAPKKREFVERDVKKLKKSVEEVYPESWITTETNDSNTAWVNVQINRGDVVNTSEFEESRLHTLHLIGCLELIETETETKK